MAQRWREEDRGGHFSSLSCKTPQGADSKSLPFPPTYLKCHYYVILFTWHRSVLTFLVYSGHLLIHASTAPYCFITLKCAFLSKPHTHTHIFSQNVLGYMCPLIFLYEFFNESTSLILLQRYNDISGGLHQICKLITNYVINQQLDVLLLSLLIKTHNILFHIWNSSFSLIECTWALHVSYVFHWVFYICCTFVIWNHYNIFSIGLLLTYRKTDFL